ncbi:MAG: hypothetical protein GQ578_08050 [Desulfuromonadaceae bacterium]|nr:hypothetical protein [Desulfuromonadaceae bacterium]
MTTDFEKLHRAAKSNKEDAADLSIAYNGRTVAMRAYNDRPGKDTKADLVATREEYEATVSRLQQKYFPDTSAAPEGERFANRKQALNWLQSQGYKVGQDKFYKDCKAGFPQIHRDKTISRYQVLQYGQQLDVDTRGSATDLSAAREESETRKAIASADREEMKRDHERRELDKNWISREEADLTVCTWAALTRDNIAGRLTKNIATFIHAVGGNLDRIAAGQAIIDQSITDGCNDIANSSEVDIEIEPRGNEI